MARAPRAIIGKVSRSQSDVVFVVEHCSIGKVFTEHNDVGLPSDADISDCRVAESLSKCKLARVHLHCVCELVETLETDRTFREEKYASLYNITETSNPQAPDEGASSSWVTDRQPVD